MATSGYSVQTESAVALVAATAKTVIGAKAPAGNGLQMKSFELAFDGVTASAVPVLVEIVSATFATNAPGTNSTSTTPRQLYGRVSAAGFTSAKNWTVEPTVLVPLKEFLLTPNAGLIAYQFPLGQEPDCALGEGLAIRCTAPANVNVRSTMSLERT